MYLATTDNCFNIFFLLLITDVPQPPERCSAVADECGPPAKSQRLHCAPIALPLLVLATELVASATSASHLPSASASLPRKSRIPSECAPTLLQVQMTKTKITPYQGNA